MSDVTIAMRALVLLDMARDELEDSASFVPEPPFVYVEREAPGPENLDPALPCFLRQQAT